ncbi:MAG: alpha-ketoacid dehydrogenase subunit beta [Rhizobiaceae bacterium]|uniref:alpha-ketoacid dehydrogenase subunit beta n=1 Tax=Parvibaculum sp. TaxID=2024848 RepID=UPI001B2AFF4D|nr:transketolase C-terminal domain-containing protein [Parvibaculum sp.]MBO6633386.1 alpha-ketoacid dehydrogenase subunit beta [Parvibaculum sp.]MBO6725855.1 alpha-ketoacid dehydrogenase subunit beta [Rhizobiaceae bacterium]
MTSAMKVTSYCDAIREGFEYVMERDERCFTIGQGLWSPWYVGRSMHDLDKRFGRERVIDTPVSELATTGAAVGASLHGYRPIVIHPRMDFMILAADQIVNQAAKWRHMLGGQVSPSVVVRGIVNRGGEQGAQHSQALHSWYAHIPGLRVVMPAMPADARDLLIGAVQSDDPVLYIDDRWLYEFEEPMPKAADVDLARAGPVSRRSGSDVTIAAASYSVRLALDAAELVEKDGISCEVIDVRVLNPFDPAPIRGSVERTGRFLAVDGGWSTCGFAAELIACVAEEVSPAKLKAAPARIALPDAPAPTSKPLEEAYYPTAELIAERIRKLDR